jgi:hypothetical protein
LDKNRSVYSQGIYENELSSNSTNDNQNQRCIFMSELVDGCESKQANGGCWSTLKGLVNQFSSVTLILGASVSRNTQFKYLCGDHGNYTQDRTTKTIKERGENLICFSQPPLQNDIAVHFDIPYS